ncbi:unnamed protein product [Clavelina lepadiformis]|uniref:Uncharacterized protein n=1 Tax=Clavelina lepadiformis TaxID=159417 RepID=A0ABP0FWY7_CLALP
MSVMPDIYWSQGDDKEVVSYVPGVDFHKNMKSQVKSKQPTKPKRHQTGIKEKKTSSKPLKTPNEAKCTKKENVTPTSNHGGARLKDLCSEDKERVANLVRELGKAGEEKEATESQLSNERKKFASQLEMLKADKEKIENDQQDLLSQYKECQVLLVMYQKKIAEQQKEVANDINRLLSTTPHSGQTKTPIKSSGRLSSNKTSSSTRSKTGDVTIGELETGSEFRKGKKRSPEKAANVSFDKVGILGESYIPTEVSGSTNTQVMTDIYKSSSFPSPDLSPDLMGVQNSSQSFPMLASHYERAPLANTSHLHPRIKRHEKRNDNPVTWNVKEDDYVKDISYQFQKNISTLSPETRKRALVIQKQVLEAEQSHLRQLLAEQEAILKLRQDELKRRHEEYTDRMIYFQRYGCFPSSSSADTSARRDYSSYKDISTERVLPEFHSRSERTLDDLPRRGEYSDTESYSLHPTADFTSIGRGGISSSYRSQSHQALSFSEPPLRIRTRYQDSSADTINRNSGEKSTLEEYPLDSKMDSHAESIGKGISFSTKGLESTKRHGLSKSTVKSTSVYSDVTTNQYSFKSLYDENTPTENEMATMTSFPRSAVNDPVSTEDLGQSSNSNSSFPYQRTADSDDMITLTATRSPRRLLQTTMNNISTLSELVDEVDSHDPTCTPRKDLSLWSPMGARGDGTITSTTFDPEDSQLIEDIFFIK